MKRISQLVLVAAIVFFLATSNVFAASNSSSLETALDEIQRVGKEKATFSLLGVYFSKRIDGYDGKVVINQNGQLFIQNISWTNGSLIYGPQMKVDNIFETRHPGGNYVIKGIYSVDLNQDGLQDIVIEVTDVSNIARYGEEIATTKDFYFAVGNGQFLKGKSEVFF